MYFQVYSRWTWLTLFGFSLLLDKLSSQEPLVISLNLNCPSTFCLTKRRDSYQEYNLYCCLWLNQRRLLSTAGDPSVQLDIQYVMNILGRTVVLSLTPGFFYVECIHHPIQKIRDDKGKAMCVFPTFRIFL